MKKFLCMLLAWQIDCFAAILMLMIFFVKGNRLSNLLLKVDIEV
mgnify:CR=1 FL=1